MTGTVAETRNKAETTKQKKQKKISKTDPCCVQFVTLLLGMINWCYARQIFVVHMPSYFLLRGDIKRFNKNIN